MKTQDEKFAGVSCSEAKGEEIAVINRSEAPANIEAMATTNSCEEEAAASFDDSSSHGGAVVPSYEVAAAASREEAGEQFSEGWHRLNSPPRGNNI